MRRMTTRLAITTLTATLALLATTTPQANAAAVQSYIYYTDGSVSGGTGNQPITFQGVSSNNSYNGYYYNGYYNSAQSTITTPGTFVLGNFVTSGILPPSATLTYNNTPFTIDVHVGTIPSTTPYANYTYDYKLSGVLNGSVSGAGQSTMLASVTSIIGTPTYSFNSVSSTPPFPISALQVNPQGIAPANGYQSTSTTLTAQVVPFAVPTPQPTPEPTSIAAFATALVGWSLRRRLRARA